MRKTIAAAMLALALAGCSGTVPSRWVPEPTTTVCHEDMACWDCETMGNKICGPKQP
jgi:hypothetical protein